MKHELRYWPEFAYRMTLKEFIDACERGSFVDYDGTGYFATNEGVSRIEAVPSKIVEAIDKNRTRDLLEGEWTHVAWFNK